MRAALRSTRQHLAILLVCLALVWLIELADHLLFGQTLDRLGIRPRSLQGLWGIPLAPLLHGGWAHLMANTVPFLVLAWLVMLRRTRDFFIVTPLVIVLGGLGVWLIAAAGTVHIGASGLIFGYVGYLLARGYFERSFGSILLALVVAVLYGGVLWGVLPGQRGISWEGHLAGFLAGVLAARLLTPSKQPILQRAY
jgi:membrane associated rhomboid family serine protease